ncbi:flagellar biosynthesis protein FlhF [Cytobacillus horneckiae]|uniref:Flagellar biosynthesis protein FlhF n=1 Tax=Cytobacillus horneckiae TaxID=549687 RepID=A0A2N0ZM19_9BACI|nr:flagellar biosynthesis protein FlhF [Cytobacillus horneckiae]MBN6887182.1 flagellar biosynthesis protein FlhF [Cytobacillus horneckiae]MCM3178227.1 flagellar biosynthesis protein FlhF [Cytobacillus horneckiae]MEC1157033.1 flagellar biosynthesis protein FlhF [Cytobacillus horneckiae]MED2939941.1 flagellar biosynthesis protein FlhF [Cytobacillus horneckiae]PKG30537.1 flagellar biosynthesis protein FlhF [Cytobacillus horneckiae]
MKAKKFIAATMSEVMKKIRAELGQDAVILHTRKVKSGGFLGLFQKQNLEVLAAVDPAIASERKANQKDSQRPAYYGEGQQQKRIQDNTNVLLAEISDLRKLINETKYNKEDAVLSRLPEPISQELNKLKKQRVDEEIIDAISASLMESWYKNDDSSAENVRLWTEQLLTQKLKDISFGGISFAKKYINVVGPTGVGKTTTLAKIAAESVIKYNKRIAFITTDTYRIAAIEQLRTYSKILDAPLEVCYNLEDFAKAMQQFSDYDVVLIDTAGRNYRNAEYVSEINKLIGSNKDIETFLVLSLTSKYEDMQEICEQFLKTPIDRFIFTKADETATVGSMLNLVINYQRGIGYITDGQDVPDDLLTGSPQKLIQAVMEGK